MNCRLCLSKLGGRSVGVGTHTLGQHTTLCQGKISLVIVCWQYEKNKGVWSSFITFSGFTGMWGLQHEVWMKTVLLNQSIMATALVPNIYVIYASMLLLLCREVCSLTSIDDEPGTVMHPVPLTNATNYVAAFSFTQKTKGALDQEKCNSGGCWTIQSARA